MARPVLPDAALLVPFLAIGAQPLQTDAAARLVELAAREDRARARRSPRTLLTGRCTMFGRNAEALPRRASVPPSRNRLCRSPSCGQ